MGTLQKIYCDTFKRSHVVGTLAIAFVCALAGPFGTYTAMGFFDRMILWGLVCFIALIIGGALDHIVARIFGQAPHLAQYVIMGAMFTLIFPLPLMMIDDLLGSMGRTPDASFAYLVEKVAASTIVMVLVRYLTPRNRARRKSQSKPRLYARLPDTGAAFVSRLTADNHYTKVVLSDGSEHMLLMRFSDAVAEMDDADGILTHRSHWVANQSIEAAARDGTREVLILQSGARIPLSRTYRDNAVKLGFL